MNTTRNSILAASAIFYLGCAAQTATTEGDEEETGEVGSALQANNGVSLNGIKMNGIKMNGVSLNGIKMNGLSLTGITLTGTVLSGVDADGALLTGPALISATMLGTLDDGGEVTLRIDAVEPTADPEITAYAVSYWTGSAWTSACGYAGTTAIGAVVLSGSWDYSEGTPTGGSFTPSASVFTLACRDAAIAKCAEMGYKPWKNVMECNAGVCVSRSLQPLHQACTRMLRADVCGDGTPHTRNGTPVNLWDRWNVQVRAKKGTWNWRKEGEWGTQGALCIDELRYEANDATQSYIDDHCPGHWQTSFACLGKQSTFFTKQGFSSSMSERSLIRNEFDGHYHAD